MKSLHNKKFLGTGLFVTLLCCFTPALVVLFGLVGLSWFTGYLDYGLTPLLGFFIVALTLILYDHYDKKYIAYLGGLIFIGLTALYFMWGIILGTLMFVGAGIAYYYHHKKKCKSCEVKK